VKRKIGVILNLALGLLAACTAVTTPAPTTSGDEVRFAQQREQMVLETIERRGITDKDVLNAMRAVPRHLFVPENEQAHAYGDYPLPIGYGQTISQPYIVALMTELLALKEGDKVLEIGTGSGYQAAILAEIPGIEVYTRRNHPRTGRVRPRAIKESGLRQSPLPAGRRLLWLARTRPFRRYHRHRRPRPLAPIAAGSTG